MSDSSPPGFPAAIRVGDSVYVGLVSAAASADMESQTASVFETLIERLEAAGASMPDLVNLRTYYLYAGEEGRGVTDYWERMTAVRLRYIADPGPAATALRVSGVPDVNRLIGVDGIATKDADRQRIMPAHAWDWSIPVPLSQGWRVGDRVLVGGQISADRSGMAVAPGDTAAQVRNVLEYIKHVLLDAGQDWSNVVSLRVCFKHTGDPVAAGKLLATILEAICVTLPAPRPALTAFGVDLLYEGLTLEIDAVSCAGLKRAVSTTSRDDAASLAGFPAACVVGDEIHLGGLSAGLGAALEVQVDLTLRHLLSVLKESGFEPSELVKLTLFYVPPAAGAADMATATTILEILRQYLPEPRPVVTVLSLPGLPHPGQRFQLDGIAVHTSDRLSFP